MARTWRICFSTKNGDIRVSTSSDENLDRYEQYLLKGEPFKLELHRNGKADQVHYVVNPEHVAFMRAEVEDEF